MNLRLDKFLADMSIGTRSEVKQYIRKKLVSVNGEVITKPEYKVAAEDCICFKNKEISYIHYEYYMLYKPAGVVTATRDKRERTVMELIDTRRKDLFPVGRLDKDTEGLLLICNDGDLAHRLLSPSGHVDKVYYAKIAGRVSGDDIIHFQQGIDIGEADITMPAELQILNMSEHSEVLVTICEGKFHQIKRMFHALNKEVVYLKRLSMGTLILDEALKPGESRRLNTEELKALKQY